MHSKATKIQKYKNKIFAKCLLMKGDYAHFDGNLLKKAESNREVNGIWSVGCGQQQLLPSKLPVQCCCKNVTRKIHETWGLSELSFCNQRFWLTWDLTATRLVKLKLWYRNSKTSNRDFIYFHLYPGKFYYSAQLYYLFINRIFERLWFTFIATAKSHLMDS